MQAAIHVSRQGADVMWAFKGIAVGGPLVAMLQNAPPQPGEVGVIVNLIKDAGLVGFMSFCLWALVQQIKRQDAKKDAADAQFAARLEAKDAQMLDLVKESTSQFLEAMRQNQITMTGVNDTCKLMVDTNRLNTAALNALQLHCTGVRAAAGQPGDWSQVKT